VPVAPLAVLAAQNGLPSILQLCLDNGAKLDWFLARTCADGAHRYPEIDTVDSPKYDETISKLLEGKRNADGNSLGEQLEEWFGGIDW
jgi:hypothetical protein